MFSKSYVVFLGVLIQLNIVSGDRILTIFPIPSPSHNVLGVKLCEKLIQRGHQVTLITPFSNKYQHPNLTVIETGMGKLDKNPNVLLNALTRTIWTQIRSLYTMTSRTMLHTINTPKVQELLHSKNEHFDLIILENFDTDAFLAFGHHYDAPVVLVTTLASSNWVNDLTGNPAPFSYLPDLFLSYSDQMTFFQRVHNTVILTMHHMYRYFVSTKLANDFVQTYFPGAPSIHDLKKRISLVLMNSHVSVNHPRPHLPHMIEVGGFHIEDTKPLSKDLQDFLDNATQGVIYFSMGSNLKSSAFPDEKRNAILKAFSNQKRQILWKWEQSHLPGQPDNVKIEKWLPQSDVLAHKNVKLFISHGGLLSTTEAVFHGVPLLGIPMFGDQRMNLANSERAGYALKVDYTTLTEDSLSNAINEMLDNDKYRDNVQKRSSIMKDRENKPIDTAMYWIEYVLRHKGAYHLPSRPAIELTWYQYYLLDVIGFLTLCLYLTYKIVTYFIKLICFWGTNIEILEYPNCRDNRNISDNCKKLN